MKSINNDDIYKYPIIFFNKTQWKITQQHANFNFNILVNYDGQGEFKYVDPNFDLTISCCKGET